MLIEIESVYGDKILHGKHFDKNQLQSIVKELICTVGENAFCSAFCTRYGYEEVTYSDGIDIDYIIDLDTHLIFTPRY